MYAWPQCRLLMGKSGDTVAVLHVERIGAMGGVDGAWAQRLTSSSTILCMSSSVVTSISSSLMYTPGPGERRAVWQ